MSVVETAAKTNTAKPKQKYKEEYGSDIFQHIFNSALSDNQKHTIAQHLLSLIKEPHSSIVKEFKAELEKVKTVCEEVVAKTPKAPLQALHEIYQWLVKNRSLRDHHATAFVCCDLTSYSFRKPKFDHYKTLVLCSAVRLAGIGDNNSPLNKVFNEIRQLGLGRRDDVARTLPKPEDFPLASLIEKLDEIRKDESTPVPIQQSVDGYYVTFNNAYLSQPGRIKKGNRQPRKKYQLHIQQEFAKDHDAEFDVLEIRELNRKGSKKIDAWQNEEKATASDDISTYSVVAQNQNTARELRENQVKARQIVQSIQRKKQYVPCDFQSLTVHEIKVLSHSVMSAAKQPDYNNVLPFLLLSLLTGRTPGKIMSQSHRHGRFNCDGFDFELTISYQAPTFKQEEEVKRIIREVNRAIYLRLPKVVTEEQLANNGITTDMGQSWLTDLNKKYSTRLTLSRICQTIHAFQRQRNLDQVIVELITDPESYKATGLPYSHVRQDKVQYFMDQYSDWLYDITGIESWKIEPPDEWTIFDPDRKVGSPLFLQENEISKCNIQHIQHLDELRDKGTANILKFHNSYVLYTYRLICLASGYRPVTGACGRLTDVCLESGKYWISDKERREGIAARMLVLPEIATNQIQSYLNHLNALHFYTQSQLPHVAGHIASIQNGITDLLFFIERNEVTSLSPKTLKPYMTEQFPVAPNWHRHFLRSFLMTKPEIPPSLIDCFMGHEDIGQEGFGRFSAFAYSDFKELANVLQQLLISLDFEVVQGCKIR